MPTKVTPQQPHFSGSSMSGNTYSSQLRTSDSSRADDSGSGSAGMHVVLVPPPAGGCSCRSQIAYLHVSQRKDERQRGYRRARQNVMFPSDGQMFPLNCHEVRQSHNSISVVGGGSLRGTRRRHRAHVRSSGHHRNGTLWMVSDRI